MEGEADAGDQPGRWEFDEDFVRAAPVAEPSARSRQNQARFVDQGEAERRAAEMHARRRRRRRRAWRVAGPVAVVAVVAAGVLVDRNPRSAEPAAFPIGVLDGGPRGAVAGVDLARPSPSAAANDRPLGEPADPPADPGPFRFVARRSDDRRPVSYDPCRPIRFVVNDDEAPQGSDRILSDAIAAISKATGLQFERGKPVREEPSAGRDAYLPDLYGDVWAPVLVAWTDPTTVPELQGDVVGIGGSTQIQTSQRGSAVYVSGLVALDGPQFDAILKRPDGSEVARAVVMHELGHLVGLDHVDDPTQIMFERGREGVVDLQSGDLAGLAELGRGECFPSL